MRNQQFVNSIGDVQIDRMFYKSGWTCQNIEDGAAMGLGEFTKIMDVAARSSDFELVIASRDLSPDAKLAEVPIDFAYFKATLFNHPEWVTLDVIVFGKSLRWFAILQGLTRGILCVQD